MFDLPRLGVLVLFAGMVILLMQMPVVLGFIASVRKSTRWFSPENLGGVSRVDGIPHHEPERNEAPLPDSEARFRAIFEQAAVGIAFMSPDGYWLRVNQKACDLLGYTADELATRTWRDVTYADDLEADAVLSRQLLAGEIPTYSLDKRYVRKDGTRIWVNITCSTLHDPTGGATQFGITVIQDITERKQAEEALRTSETRYRTLMEQASDAIFVADSQAHYVDVNTAACQLLGYTREELLNLGVRDVVSPEDLAQRNIPWDEMRAGTVIMPRWLVRKDGARVPTEVSAKLLDDGRLQVFARDITGRQQMEDALRASEERLRVALHNMPVMMDAFAEDGRIIVWNRECEEVTGYSAEEIIGNPDALRLLYPGDEWESLFTEVAAYPANYRNVEFELTAKDGCKKTISWSSLAQQIPITGWASWAVGVDVTERKQAEARELQSRIEQEKIAMLKQFIGDISHDFRTPFSVMGTSIYLLKKSTDPEKRLQHLDKLQAQIAHVQNLFEDQLILLKLDMDETKFDFEVCDLDMLIRDLVTQQEELAARKALRLVYSSNTRRLRVRVDKGLLMTALRRLVLNALHYTPNGGTVDIQTRLLSEQVVIEVHDTGIGIDAEEIPEVFDRFYRSNKARGMETGGSGLGLTIARKIVEAHGGTIEAESRVGAGSVFRLILPTRENLDH